MIVHNERELMGAVIHELVRQDDRLVWHHCGAAFRCAGPAGMPDLVIAGPGGLILAELKSEYGELSAGQQAWQWALGDRHRLWRPADWYSGRVQAEIVSLAKGGT